MTIEIDQSNKIEQISKNTFIGLSNSKKYTIVIPSKVKRRLQEEFRRQGKTLLFNHRTFVAGVVLLLRYANIDSRTQIVIDFEYYGYERRLGSMFVEMWSRFSQDIPNIEFKSIGKRSRAHEIAYFTMKGKYKPDRMLNFGEIRQLVLK